MITVTWPWPQFILRAELHVSSLSELMCTWQCIKLRDKPAVTWALPLPVPGAQGAQSSSQQQSLAWKGPGRANWTGPARKCRMEEGSALEQVCVLVPLGNVSPHGQGRQQGKQMSQEWQLDSLPTAWHFRWQARELQWENQRFLSYGLPLCILVKNKNVFLHFYGKELRVFSWLNIRTFKSHNLLQR